MTTIIERVAAAIEEEALRQRTSFAAWGGMRGLIPPLRMNDIARAAILAMREPTEGMVDAMDKGTPDGFTRYDNERERRHLAYTMPYQAAIDAALAEDVK